MADPQGFLKTRERELPRRRPVPVRIRDWKEVYEEQPVTELQRQAGRCMDCGIPFCHSGCPLGNLIPEWNDLAWKGEWRQAIDRLHATNNFPEFTGRLCPAPCESACVLGINQPAVTIKQVEVSIIDRAFANGTVTPEAPERLSGKTVAVVGSGPAGLAAAQQLTRAGHTVAVYERADQPGGLLRYGIPEFKMEKSVLDRRIAQMKAEGTRFRTGVEVGARPHRRRPAQAVRRRRRRDRRHRAARPAGARARARRRHAGDGLPAAGQPGRARPERRRARSPPTGKDVIVIGGGDTGADCIGTAHRQGARSVTSLEIMPQPPAERAAHQPWPTYPMTFRVASRARGGRRPGVRRVDQRGRRRRAGPGRGAAPARGAAWARAASRRSRAASKEIPAQLVLLAMGFLGPQQRAARPARRRARRAHQRRPRRRLHDRRARASSSPATPVVASRSSSGRSPRAAPPRTRSTPG